MSNTVSIVIPTRNRRPELMSTLENILCSTHEDFIVHVFDNASTDGTEEAVREILDTRVQYQKSKADLSVTKSFEAAYSFACADWVTGLGADDGFSHIAIAEMLSLAKTSCLEAVASQHASYHWPGLTSEHGRLFLRANQDDAVRASQSVVREVLSGHKKFQALPTAYKSGLVHRNVLDRIRSRSNRLFNSWNPDVFLGFAVAQAINYFVMSGRPLTISGTSSSSTGWSSLGGGADPSAGDEYFALSQSGGIGLAEQIAEVDGTLPRSIIIMTYEAYLKAVPRRTGRDRILSSPLFQLGVLLSDSRKTPPEVIQWSRRLARAEAITLGAKARWIVARLHSRVRTIRALLRRLESFVNHSRTVSLAEATKEIAESRKDARMSVTVFPGPETVADAAMLLNSWVEPN